MAVEKELIALRADEKISRKEPASCDKIKKKIKF